MRDFGKDTNGRKSFVVFRIEDNKPHALFKTPNAKTAWKVFYRNIRVNGYEKKYILVKRSYDKFNCLKFQRVLIKPTEA